MNRPLRIAAVLPARNEQDTIAAVVCGLRGLRGDGAPLIARVVVCDNGSHDATAERARTAGAEVVQEAVPGYGAACLRALAVLAVGAECCDAVLFVDADGSADLTAVPALLDALTQGADLVIGARHHAEPGALTPPQRLGNALACWLIRRLWNAPVTDLGPLRAIRTTALHRIGMRDRAYGWTVEMQLRAITAGLRTIEVPVCALARRAGRSKVSGTWRGVIGAGCGIIGTIVAFKWRTHCAGERARSAQDVA